MTKNETQLSQEYETPEGILLDLQNHYTAELRECVKARNIKRYKIIMACIAAINPKAYKQVLLKRKEK